MIEINEKVVFVKGAHNGAIYNFNDGNVYAISRESCVAIDKYGAGQELTSDEQKYIDLLSQNNLLKDSHFYRDYVPSRHTEKVRMCWLEITELCNCKCVHCYEGQSHCKRTNPLSLEEWKDIIDQLKELEVNNVIIIGGEPCIHPDIKPIVRYVAEKNIPATLFTNGTLFDDELRQIVLDCKLKLKFSLYGHCAELHDSITKKKGSFERLINSINYFVTNGIDVNISIVLMHENEAHYDEIIRFVDSLGVKKYKTDVIREVYGGTQNSHVPTLDRIVNLKKRRKPVFPKVNQERFDRAFFENTCWSGRIVVSEDGTVLPCVFERDILLGNVRNNSLNEIINAKPAKLCWEHCFEKIDECAECEFRFACKDCRPLAKGAHGDLNAKNPRCTYDVHKGVWL